MGFVTSLKPWQLIVLLAVLTVGAGASYGTYSLFTGPDESNLEADQQLVPVQLGNLVNEVSVNGRIIYPNREALRFSSQGTLAELLVVEGQSVQENDPLASLDSETVANLERSVAQARVTLRDAEKALDEFGQPASELQIAQAESGEADAEIALSKAIEALDLLQNPTELLIAQAVAKVAGADVAVSNAIEALDLLQNPTELLIAQAEAKVAGAEIALSSAIETLDLLQNPTELQIAQAEAKVAGASLALLNAQDALDKLNEPASQQAIASAELRVASAELALQSATDLLETLKEPASALAIAQAEAKLTEAKLVEAKAGESTQAIQTGPSPEELSDAGQKIESAQTALTNAVAELSFVTGDWERKLESASTELQRETDDYLSELKRWLGADLDAGLLDGNVDIVLDALGADLTVLFDPGLRFGDLFDGGYFSEGLPTDDPETQWNEVIVFTWLNFSPAEIVATCDQSAAPAQGFCVRQELDAVAAAYQKAVDNLDSQTVQSAKAAEAAEGAVAKAEDVLIASQDALADLTEPADALSIEDAERQLALASASVQNAEDALAETLEPASQLALDDQAAQVELARANLLQAIEDLSELKVPPDAAVLANQLEQVDLAKASLAQAQEDLSVLTGPPDDAVLANQLEQVDLAKASLAQAQVDLSELTGPPDDAVLGNQQTQIDLAKVSLAQAEEDLAQLLADPDRAELEAKRLGIEVARLNLEELTVELADLTLDPDPLDLSLVQANVATAQAALDQAETRLASAIIRAPWAGIISAIAVEVGDNVNLSTPIMEIVDPTVVEIDGMVDEIDVLFVRLGSRSVVSMDALPGQIIEGTVASIESTARTQQGVVSYPLRIRVTPPEGMDLPEGLSAVASVVIREDRGVLLVPIQSLYGSFEEPTVKVMVDGSIVDTPVVLGNNDDFWAVVSDGVAEGDLVIMQSQETQTDRFRFGAAFRGGAVLGGGGGRGRR